MDPVSRNAALVYKHLETALQAANAVTFDDLLILPVQMLDRDPQLRARFADRFQFVLVDEYQDTNRAQYRLIKLIGGEHGNIVGGWRSFSEYLWVARRRHSQHSRFRERIRGGTYGGARA